MIYFDNAATTVQKPPEVAEKVLNAINSFGNPGRSFHSYSMDAARAVYDARQETAKLVRLQNPLNVAFTSGATESFNLVVSSLIGPDDHVITTVLEHNSVLRPLYKTGCQISFIPCDGNGCLELDNLNPFLKKNTRFLICTHGSNVTGCVTDVDALRRFCRENGLIFILDVSQTLGSIKTYADMADILCFTGHKALMGPQGTGGIIVNRHMDFKLVKTGGSGSDTYNKHQPLSMPDIFEAGTLNAHGIAGLKEGISYINRIGIEMIESHESALRKRFLDSVSQIPGIRLYGAGSGRSKKALPIVSLNIGDLSSEDLAMRLWEGWRIATRPGSHCAPLVHAHFKTEEQGMVRFSFGVYNTADEVDYAIKALTDIAKQEGF